MHPKIYSFGILTFNKSNERTEILIPKLSIRVYSFLKAKKEREREREKERENDCETSEGDSKGEGPGNLSNWTVSILYRSFSIKKQKGI